jgi:hypothetical protein
MKTEMQTSIEADRVLLERAAKAAGLWDAENNCIDIPWNALTNDGDALRLAVKLGMQLSIDPSSGFVDALTDAGPTASECSTTDPYAATRRAIVRAAAALAD